MEQNVEDSILSSLLSYYPSLRFHKLLIQSLLLPQYEPHAGSIILSYVLDATWEIIRIEKGFLTSPCKIHSQIEKPKTSQTSGIGSKIVRWGAVFYQDTPLTPQLPSTISITGMEEQDLRIWGVRLGRVRGAQPGIGWILSGYGRPVKVQCRWWRKSASTPSGVGGTAK